MNFEKQKSILICIFCLLMSHSISAASTLSHRWSFNNATADDSIGTADGVLVNNTGDAVIANGSLTLGNDGTQTSNDNTGDYLDLPNGIISANGNQATFEFWVTWNDAQELLWAEFMSFGTSNGGEDQSSGGSNSTYIMMTPKNRPTEELRTGYRYGLTGTEKVIDHSSVMPLNQETHVALVWDGANATALLYVDGQLSDENSIHFNISNDLIDNNNWLGRSQYDDPMFVGSYNEVRVYGQALSESDIAANCQAGPNAMPVSNPIPADGSNVLPASVSWSPSQILSGPLTGYDVYLGTDKAAVAAADDTDTSGIYHDTINPTQTTYMPPEVLEAEQEYFWRIDQRFAGQIVKGPVWSFNKQPEQWQMKQAPLMTPWASQVDPGNVLPEYPRPQMVRNDWMNLNGIWQFTTAEESSPVPFGQGSDREILVPFPVESAISGIMQTYSRFFYRRLVDLPAGWENKQIILNMEASDWETEVYVNGSSVGIHQGGYDPFSFNITPYLNASGSQEIIVRIYDPTELGLVPHGKQWVDVATRSRIYYTPCSGIWDTIWLEAVNPVYIRDIHLVPDVDNQLLSVNADIQATNPNQYSLVATAKIGSYTVGTASGPAGLGLQVLLSELHLWNTYDPFLYDLEIELRDGQTVLDHIDSYFGMRKVDLQEKDGALRIFVNDEFIFQMGPLDQGYWPDGIYRAPTDEALKWDLNMIKACGYNMLRKHVKVEPRRWYYWADKLGILVWQDMPSIRPTAAKTDQAAHDRFETELEQLVKDHWNHPSIIMWIVFNEAWGQYNTVELTDWTMQMDPSRLVSCASGYTDYPVGHIIDKHGYPSPRFPSYTADRAMVSGEYGGVGFFIDDHVWDTDSWGYASVETSEELLGMYESLYNMFSGGIVSPGMSAGVYTQITDVETEINGIITYDRKVLKVDPNDVRRVHEQLYAKYYEIIPTSEEQPQTWKYTMVDPNNSSWVTPEFDDTSWSEGPGGFGTDGTPAAVIGTVWDTSDIWIRRNFLAPELTDFQEERMSLRVHHDEDAEIYLNGVLAAVAPGYTKDYFAIEMTEAGKAAYMPGQVNTLAVHCTQTSGGQYIDVGLQYRGCLCIPGQCYDLTGNGEVTLEDLAEIARLWLIDYDLDYLAAFSQHWLECK